MSTHYERLGWIKENKIKKRRQMKIRSVCYNIGQILAFLSFIVAVLGAAAADSPSIWVVFIAAGISAIIYTMSRLFIRISCREIKK